MRPVRPLDLTPGGAGAEAPAKRRRALPPRRWPGWVSPLAAAVAAVAVAATLVAVRDVSGTGLASGSSSAAASAPASTSVLSNGVPRYYVTETTGGSGAIPETTVFVGDTQTGKKLATFKAPPGVVFGTVTGSADDRTFVVAAREQLSTGPSWSWHLIWYVIRLTPGGAPQARLTRIPVTASFTTGAVSGVAMSPDGRAFAVVFRAASASNGVVTSADLVTLRTYSVATGRVLHTWTAPPSQRDLYAFGDLSWLDDGHTLAFAYPADAEVRDVRTLNTSSRGTNLVADSKPVFSVPAGHACNSTLMMTADGKSVICGIFGPNNGWCTTGQLTLSAYSVATGKLERVLYRYQGKCSLGFAIVVWAKSGALAIGVITVSKLTAPPSPGPFTVRAGVVTPGKFASLPIIVTDDPAGYEAPGGIAF
jgi:hypothetical protein